MLVLPTLKSLQTATRLVRLRAQDGTGGCKGDSQVGLYASKVGGLSCSPDVTEFSLQEPRVPLKEDAFAKP